MVLELRATKQEILREYGDICVRYSHSTAKPLLKEPDAHYYYLEKDELAFSAVTNRKMADMISVKEFIEEGDNITISKTAGGYIYAQTRD